MTGGSFQYPCWCQDSNHVFTRPALKQLSMTANCYDGISSTAELMHSASSNIANPSGVEYICMIEQLEICYNMHLGYRFLLLNVASKSYLMNVLYTDVWDFLLTLLPSYIFEYMICINLFNMLLHILSLLLTCNLSHQKV